ncbi:MAG TPA: glycoside hydrolase family 16 protein [Sediminibacterium sp.]|nr:glycoside hydrolase family 16 protein [Sediminibacterium sp.]
MKTRLCLLFFLIAPVLRAQLVSPADTLKGYKLVWADEFNRDGAPDSSNWGFEHGFVRNHELQYYQPENAYCANGYLIIEARKEIKPNPAYQPGSKDWRVSRDSMHYTSACLLTKGRHQWQYGHFEMRARIDISPGMWPAWWTLGVSRRWPANGEIDIMEYYRGMLLANIACLNVNRSAEWFSHRYSTDSLGGKGWSSKFHQWTMDWDALSIRLSVDGHLLNETPLTSLVNKDGSGFQPFSQPHYMLLNLAIGGDNGGDPSSTSFPRKFEIDYVRVYQQKAE